MKDYTNVNIKEVERELNALDYGSVVYIDPTYDWTEKKTGKKFFVSVLNGGCVLLSDTKKGAIQDHAGHIYNICGVVRF